MASTSTDDQETSFKNLTAEILRSRARALAQVGDGRDGSQTLYQLVEFQLAGERYGIDTLFVQEVHPLKELTPLPGTPSFLLGIVNIRSSILPIIDLKKFFGLPGEGITDLNKIIIVQNKDVWVGILADIIWGVTEIEQETIQRELAALDGVRADYFQGVTSQRLIVLDIATILGDSRILVNDSP